jgi:hypothetical protein
MQRHQLSSKRIHIGCRRKMPKCERSIRTATEAELTPLLTKVPPEIMIQRQFIQHTMPEGAT